MVKHRRQTATLIITACAGLVLAVWPFQALAAGVGAEDAKSSSNAISNDSNFDKTQNGSDANAELFRKMMLSVLLVAVLGVAALYVSKRVLPKLTNLPGKRIKVVETVHLGARRSIHLLHVDNHCMLVGSTNERITKLADISGAGPDFSVEFASRIGDENDR